jgi:hypothetical protein
MGILVSGWKQCVWRALLAITNVSFYFIFHVILRGSRHPGQHFIDIGQIDCPPEQRGANEPSWEEATQSQNPQLSSLFPLVSYRCSEQRLSSLLNSIHHVVSRIWLPVSVFDGIVLINHIRSRWAAWAMGFLFFTVVLFTLIFLDSHQAFAGL